MIRSASRFVIACANCGSVAEKPSLKALVVKTVISTLLPTTSAARAGHRARQDEILNDSFEENSYSGSCCLTKSIRSALVLAIHST